MDLMSYLMGMRDPAAGGGTSDYAALSNKPSIGGVTLSGNKTAEDLGLLAVEAGKGLSTNDFTDADKVKLSGIAEGAEVNVIDGMTVNGDAVPVVDKTAALTMPTKVSDLTNDAGYQDAQQVEDAINAKVSSAYKAGGSATMATLPALTAAKLGTVVNMAESFTTTADFLEGVGKTYPAGTNVVVAIAGENVYKYDVLAGFIDLPGKQDKLPATGAANRGVYVSAAGVVSVMSHTLDKDVPADAAFTDTVTEVDDTLSNAGQAADAKATGDKIAALKSENALLRELVNGIDAPIYRDASGNPVTFSDGYLANVKALSVEITPSQSGSGDPSPENIRPISGVSSVSVTRTGENGANAQSVTVTLTDGTDPLTVYGGTLNVTTGELTVTHEKITLNGSENWKKQDPTGDIFRYFYTGAIANVIKPIQSTLVVGDLLCSSYPVVTFAQIYDRLVDKGIAQHIERWGSTIGVRDNDAENLTAAQWKEWLAQNPIEVVYPLANPVTYQLTPAQIATLSGYNAVTTDAGTLSVTYRADPTITLGGG